MMHGMPGGTHLSEALQHFDDKGTRTDRRWCYSSADATHHDENGTRGRFGLTADTTIERGVTLYSRAFVRPPLSQASEARKYR